jgi:competence protein ComEC
LISQAVEVPVDAVWCWALIVAGAGAAAAALRFRRWQLWLAAGLLLAGGRGLTVNNHNLALEHELESSEPLVVRAGMTVLEGWTATRWGWRSRARVHHARRAGRELELPGRCRLEVRGSAVPDLLPEPGSEVEGLVAVRGEAGSPLLLASSPKLLQPVRDPHGLPRLRDRLARTLLAAADVDVDRIRSAELAAAITLGRRDLLPDDRREGWRRSGLAHLLAVSGLHVGLVGGLVWLAAVASGVRPRTARVIVLLALPGYAMLAGASPSAVRAAVMGMVYLGARLLGRGLIPMAAVLLTATVLLLARPELVVDAGFQLTVLITAALVRWVPEVVERLPLPRWPAGLLAVPVVAQLAAAPIVAWHFRSAVPGAVAANLLVPVLLAPTLVSGILGVLTAPVWPAAAGWCLDALHLAAQLLWMVGGAGRALEVVLPAMPPATVTALAIAGWLALQVGRRARIGAVCWALAGALTAGWWWVRPRPTPPRVELLEVADGLAAVVATSEATMLLDGGRWTHEATRRLADRGHGAFDVVVASHTDEDHVAGLPAVLAAGGAGRLVVPVWMMSEPEVVPLLRAARDAGADVRRVARGSAIRVGGTVMEVLWPPAADPPEIENERSLVARIGFEGGVVLVTSDIGRTTEVRLARLGSMACDVLIVPHHGSRNSASSALLAATMPEIALIPAGPRNIHGHPHAEVLERLESRAISFRFPKRHGLCGACLVDGKWKAFP